MDIREQIDAFEASNCRLQMRLGADYYGSENTAIMSRKMLIYAEEDGVPHEVEDPYKANHKLPAGYFKVLVDQKINYSLGRDITFEVIDPDHLWQVLGKSFQSKLRQIGKMAAIKAVGWAHPYIDTEGVFQFAVIPAEQVIATYEPGDETKIIQVIRYYKVGKTNWAEVWDERQVAYYVEDPDTRVYRLLTENEMLAKFGLPYPNPKAHFNKTFRYGARVAKNEGLSWGAVPFVPLYNNDEDTTDLKPVKAFIDAYDIVNSDFVNNLEDFQDLYWILKGYDGSGLAQFLYQVKRYKTLKVSDDGDARAEKIDIPFEARREALSGLEQDIFAFGMGVNPNAIGDGNITNVVIRSRYAALDLKAAQFEQEVADFIGELMKFVNLYRVLVNQPYIELEDIVFNRTTIINEAEMLDINTRQMGTVSEDTRLSNHPWVDAVDMEKELMEAERKTINLDLVTDDAE